jgi:hypothetical protein
VLTNELAAEVLPSQKFGANAAWFRLNVLLDNLLSAFKRIALPPELHDARPKRLRCVLLNGIGKVVRHARETVLRLVGDGPPPAGRRRQARPRHRSAVGHHGLSARSCTARPRRSGAGPPTPRSASIEASHSLETCNARRPTQRDHRRHTRPNDLNPSA